MDYFRNISKGAAALIGTLLLFVAIFLIAVYGFGFLQRETANYRGETQAIEQTQANADFRLNSYNLFFDLCGSVQSLEDRIEFAEDKVLIKTGTAQEADAQAELTALLSSRSQLVREYNNKASRDFTEGQFLSASLPYRLDIDNMETQCAN